MTVINLPNQDRRGDGSFDDGRVGASMDDPVTGPLPLTDLVDGHLHVTERRGVIVATVDGALDDALASKLAPALERMFATAGAALLDLDHATLLERAPLEALLTALDGVPDTSPRCVVAGRLSGRMVLDRWLVASRFAIFSNVADALQARAFAESGYGNGWTPTPSDA